MNDAERQQYEAGARVIGEESPVMEQIECIRAGVEGVDPAHCSFDPRKERKTKQHDPKPEPPPVTAESLLETWYWYRTSGRLKSVGAKEAGDGGEGQDEALIASLYVEATPGYSDDALKPILLHKLDGKPWQFWYGPQTRALAAAMFAGFKDELSRRLKEEPFVVYATTARTPDHLEQADMANDFDTSDRNARWKGRAA